MYQTQATIPEVDAGSVHQVEKGDVLIICVPDTSALLEVRICVTVLSSLNVNSESSIDFFVRVNANPSHDYFPYWVTSPDAGVDAIMDVIPSIKPSPYKNHTFWLRYSLKRDSWDRHSSKPGYARYRIRVHRIYDLADHPDIRTLSENMRAPSSLNPVPLLDAEQLQQCVECSSDLNCLPFSSANFGQVFLMESHWRVSDAMILQVDNGAVAKYAVERERELMRCQHIIDCIKGTPSSVEVPVVECSICKRYWHFACARLKQRNPEYFGIAFDDCTENSPSASRFEPLMKKKRSKHSLDSAETFLEGTNLTGDSNSTTSSNISSESQFICDTCACCNYCEDRLVVENCFYGYKEDKSSRIQIEQRLLGTEFLDYLPSSQNDHKECMAADSYKVSLDNWVNEPGQTQPHINFQPPMYNKGMDRDYEFLHQITTPIPLNSTHNIDTNKLGYRSLWSEEAVILDMWRGPKLEESQFNERPYVACIHCGVQYHTECRPLDTVPSLHLDVCGSCSVCRDCNNLIPPPKQTNRIRSFYPVLEGGQGGIAINRRQCIDCYISQQTNNFCFNCREPRCNEKTGVKCILPAKTQVLEYIRKYTERPDYEYDTRFLENDITAAEDLEDLKAYLDAVGV